MKYFRVLLGAVALAIIATALLVGSASGTTQAKQPKGDEVTLEFSVTYTGVQAAADIVPLILKAANIGSSGQDGVRSDFIIDSFFDITYEVSFDDVVTKGDETATTIAVEIDAIQVNPDIDAATLIDGVGNALRRDKKHPPHEYVGHVTLLR